MLVLNLCFREHETEYGRHWNFSSLLSFFLYLAIQLLGLSVGTIILPPFPSFFRRRQKMLLNNRRNIDPAVAGNNVDLDIDITAPRQTEKTATELCSYGGTFWDLFVFSRSMGHEGGVSRRMVKKTQLWYYDTIFINWIFFEVKLPYILWVTAYNTFFLLLYLALDMWIFSVGDSGGGKITKSSQKSRCAASCHLANSVQKPSSINRHSLVIFLLVNPFFPLGFNIWFIWLPWSTLLLGRLEPSKLV